MSSAPDPLFASRPPERTRINPLPWAVAGVFVLALCAAILVPALRTKRTPANAILPLDARASTLVLTGLQMSESTSLSGGKSTYIDGHVQNAGAQTVTGATVQVLFANDEAMPPQVVTQPLALIRTREPYVDTQSITEAPLVPGAEREFRLIFEDLRPNWNRHLPEIHVVRVVGR